MVGPNQESPNQESGPATLCCSPIIGEVIADEQADVLAARLKALADPIRLRLVSLVACSPTGELCACDLPELLGRSQPTISHHLKLLVEAGLLDREQRGKWAWFSLRNEALREIRIALGGVESSSALSSGADASIV